MRKNRKNRKVKLTTEQASVVEAQGDLIIVNALAGTGKTTTLEAFARRRPDKKILYVAFNRAVAQEARKRMPSNVTVKTSHSLAWNNIARGWPKGKLGILKPKTVADEYGLDYLKAESIVTVIRSFCYSSESNLQKHFSRVRGDLLAKVDFDLVYKVWKRVIDPYDPLPAEHDVYFKLWQLSRPKLGYDIILLDEAQDTNPALLDVIQNQCHAQRVIVGDEHQSIYAFRGAVNAIKMAKQAPHVPRYLTGSFRFGQKIAQTANIVLARKKETHFINGLADGGTVSVRKEEKGMQTIYLCRTNAGLFDRAVKLCRQGKLLHFVGGFNTYPFQDILDTYYLWTGDYYEIRNPFIRSFENFEDLEQYAEKTEDQELLVRLKVVEKYGHRIPDLYEQIEENSVQAEEKSDTLLSTVHKAKGGEWGQVVLGGDYLQVNERKGNKKKNEQNNQELNILYVAITRAQKHLCLSETVACILREYWEEQKRRRLRTNN